MLSELQPLPVLSPPPLLTSDLPENDPPALHHSCWPVCFGLQSTFSRMPGMCPARRWRKEASRVYVDGWCVPEEEEDRMACALLDYVVARRCKLVGV